MSRLRKKRVKKKKDRSTMIFFILFFIVITIVIGLMIFIPKLKSDDDSMPDQIPDIKGEVLEKEENDIISVKTIFRSSESMDYDEIENITIDDKTDIFWMGKRDEGREKAYRSDIIVGTRVAVWGDRDPDGTWRARDIGIMRNKPQKRA